VQLLRATLNRTRGGTVWFLDTGGNKIELQQNPLITRLFETIRDGSGKFTKSVLTHSTELNPTANVVDKTICFGENPMMGYFGNSGTAAGEEVPSSGASVVSVPAGEAKSVTTGRGNTLVNL